MSPKDRIRQIAAFHAATADVSHLEPPPRRRIKIDVNYHCSGDPLPGYDRDAMRKRWEAEPDS